MKGNRMRLVLDEYPRVHFGEEMKLLAHRLAEVGGTLLQFQALRSEPDLGAVAADGRSGERREQLVDRLDGSPADERNAPSRQIEQIAQRLAQSRWHHDAGRRIGDIDQRAVDVE